MPDLGELRGQNVEQKASDQGPSGERGGGLALGPEGHLAAGFPPEYIPSERLRMEAYRRLGSFARANELEGFADELEDRFGSLPEPAKNMFKVVEVKIHAARSGYSSVSVADNKVYFKGDAGVYRRNGMIPVINPANSPKFKLENLLEIARLVRPIES